MDCLWYLKLEFFGGLEYGYFGLVDIGVKGIELVEVWSVVVCV